MTYYLTAFSYKMSVAETDCLNISSRTGKDYRDDGSFWRSLRDAFHFELPTEVLQLIHKYYVVADFEHTYVFLLSICTNERLLLDLQRTRNASKEVRNCMCLCGKIGGCIYDIPQSEDVPEGYDIHCAAGDWVIGEEFCLKGHIENIEGECEKRGLAVA